MISVAPWSADTHSDFANHARSESGDSGVIDGAKILAMTVVDLWANNGNMEAAQQSSLLLFHSNLR